MQILPENVKIFNLNFSWFLPEFHSWGGFTPPSPRTHTPGRNVPASMLQGAHEINV
jgi:hypothetical protein